METPDDAPSLVDVVVIAVHIEHVQLHKNYSTHCQYTRGCSYGGPLIVILCCMTAIATTATHIEILTVTYVNLNCPQQTSYKGKNNIVTSVS